MHSGWCEREMGGLAPRGLMLQVRMLVIWFTWQVLTVLTYHAIDVGNVDHNCSGRTGKNFEVLWLQITTPQNLSKSTLCTFKVMALASSPFSFHIHHHFIRQFYHWLSHPQHSLLHPHLSAQCSRTHPKVIFGVHVSRASIGTFCGVYASFSSMLMWFCCPGCLVILVSNLWGEFASSTSIDTFWCFCSWFQPFLGSLQYSTCPYV